MCRKCMFSSGKLTKLGLKLFNLRTHNVLAVIKNLFYSRI